MILCSSILYKLCSSAHENSRSNILYCYRIFVCGISNYITVYINTSPFLCIRIHIYVYVYEHICVYNQVTVRLGISAGGKPYWTTPSSTMTLDHGPDEYNKTKTLVEFGDACSPGELYTSAYITKGGKTEYCRNY